MDLKLLKMRCEDSKQHHVMFQELYSVSSLLCIAQNACFEIPYKVSYFERPFLIIFKYYAWASCALTIVSGITINSTTTRFSGVYLSYDQEGNDHHNFTIKIQKS